MQNSCRVLPPPPPTDTGWSASSRACLRYFIGEVQQAAHLILNPARRDVGSGGIKTCWLVAPDDWKFHNWRAKKKNWKTQLLWLQASKPRFNRPVRPVVTGINGWQTTDGDVKLESLAAWWGIAIGYEWNTANIFVQGKHGYEHSSLTQSAREGKGTSSLRRPNGDVKVTDGDNMDSFVQHEDDTMW